MKVGAAVTTYNKPEILKICLEGVLNQTYVFNQIFKWIAVRIIPQKK